MNVGRSTTDSARRHHLFFVATSGAFLVTTLVGFAPSFFLMPFFDHPGLIALEAQKYGDGGGESTLGLPLRAIVHGVLATAWMGLFFVQTLLIHSGRRALHQTLGVGGLFIAAGVFLSGVYALVLATPRMIDLADPPDPSVVIAEVLPGMGGDLGSFLFFICAVGAAAYFRRRAVTHKYLMLLASMSLVTVPIARIWMNSGLDDALEVWAPAMENTLVVLILGGDWLIRRRVPWVLLGGFIVLFALYGGMAELGSTEAAQSWALGWMA